MSDTSDQTYLRPDDSPSPQLKQQRILERTLNASQKHTNAFKQLKTQGLALKKANNNINDIKKERKLLHKHLNHMKRDKHWFKKLIFDCCCSCCCCECCRDSMEEKKVSINMTCSATTTESEEEEPDSETVQKLWNTRYEPRNWFQSMDQNLKRLQEEAEQFEIEANKQNHLIVKMDKKANIQTKQLKEANNKMTQIIDD